MRIVLWHSETGGNVGRIGVCFHPYLSSTAQYCVAFAERETISRGRESGKLSEEQD